MLKQSKSKDLIFQSFSSPDYLPREQLSKLQFSRLRNVVHLAYYQQSSGIFKRRMDELRLKPEDLTSLSMLSNLPFSLKSDLRDSYPFGMFTVPHSEVVRIHASSGTTGKPIVVGYTKDDIDVWSEVMMRSFAACGLTREDIIQVSYGYGLFTGGLGAHYGAENLGAMVVPVSGGNTERQIMLMKDFGVTAICCTPSYFLFLAEKAMELGVDIKTLPVKAGIFGAEPWSQSMREHIESTTNIQAFDIYGLSEIIGPGVGVECQFQNGLHIFEDHFYPEIIDPISGEVLPDGEEGELVLTTLSKRAIPMIRYRTRDITSIISEPCPCGRTIRRIRRIGRRSDDMLIIRGVNVYPSQIETALLKIEGILPHYQIVLTRENGLDNIEVQVEITSEKFSDQVKDVESLRKRISHAISSTVGINAQIKLVEARTIARSEGKAKRVIDRRGL